MLVTTKIVKTPSVERLLKLWAARYIPDLSSLYGDKVGPLSQEKLLQLTSAEGRALTVDKLHQRLIEVRCQLAGIQTKSLYAYIPNIVELSDTKKLTEVAFEVYVKLLEIYRRPSSNFPQVSPLSRGNVEGASLASWTNLTKQALGMPPIEELATELEPVLLIFQKQHTEAKDWRTLGFITTLLNFSNQLLSPKLTPLEQVLIKPYFKFVEEQVAHPWQRVCAAATQYPVDSLVFSIVEQMLPAAAEIAEIVYSRLIQLLPNHISRRGRLTDPGITHSCIRDLQMFQAYFWLCFLKGSMAPVEDELVDLCAMVLPGVEVKWEMTELWNQLLTEEILERATPTQRYLLEPYTKWLQQAFFKERERFFVSTTNHQSISDLEDKALLFRRKWLYEQSMINR